MKAASDFNFTTIAPTKKSLSNFVVMLRSLYQNLVGIVNGNVGFGDGTHPDNLAGAWINVTAPAVANTDFTVTHNLSRLPVGYWIMEKDRSVDVYTGSVAATKTQLTLRATVASAVLRLFVVCLLLGFASSLYAQTTVNLTVQDTPDNQTWNNGTWTVKLQIAPGQPPPAGPFTIISGGGSVASQNGTLSATGTASFTLPANSNIAPANSVWVFNVCAQGSGGCFSANITVTTSSPQTVTISPPSPRVNLTTTAPPISLYSTTEAVGAAIGSQFYLIGTGIQACSAVSGNLCTTWASSGGGGSAGTQLDAMSYGAKPDGIRFTDGSVTGSPARTVSCTSQCNFTASDVGKEISGWGTTCASAAIGSQVNVFPAGTTIAAFVDSKHVTTSATASGSAACIEYGTNNDVALTALEAAMGADTKCIGVVLPAGMMMTDLPHLYTQPPGCAVTPQVQGGGVGGGGEVIGGQGPQATVIEYGNAYASNISTKCTHGSSGAACSYLPPNTIWHDFSFSGGGETLSGVNVGAKTLVEADNYTVLRNMLFLNYGEKASSILLGIKWTGSSVPTWSDKIVMDGFGIGQDVAANLFAAFFDLQDNCGIGGFGMLQVETNSSVSFQGGENLILSGPCTAAAGALLELNGTGSTVSGNVTIGGPNGATNAFYSVFFNGNNNTLSVTRGVITPGVANAYGIVFNTGVSGNIVRLDHTKVSTTTANLGIVDFGTGVNSVFDDCGNSFSGASFTNSLVFGTCSFTGTVPVTGNFALTNASFTSVVGTDQKHFVLNITATAASPITIVYTFPTSPGMGFAGFLSAPGSCHAQDIGGTNPLLTFSTSVAPTKTAVTFLSSAAAVNTDTLQVAIDCQ